jgi:hypothetical protein
MATHKEIRNQAEKVSRQLEKLDEMCSEARNDYDSPGLDNLSDIASDIVANDFLGQFEPKEHEVSVWIAVEHRVKVTAIDEEAAVEYVAEHFRELEFTQHGQAENDNMLDGSPYDPVVVSY